jgi:hypothetical protein
VAVARIVKASLVVALAPLIVACNIFQILLRRRHDAASIEMFSGTLAQKAPFLRSSNQGGRQVTLTSLTARR